MRLSEYASTQRTYGSRKVPRSVQQSIPIDQIYEDGTWRCGNVYSQMWSMPDINFTMSDEDNKAKMNNRLICFNIQSLGDQLRPIAMMSLLEFINMQVMTNRRKDATAATWIYFDEIHVLLKDPMSSNFLYSSWKRFRKYNAYATGISQDIQDYLDNPVAYALLSNSEFVIMLRQSKSLEALERLYGLSKPQLEFLRNASEGHGIIKMGNSMIPFSNLEPKDTAVYKLITTKPGEATAEK